MTKAHSSREHARLSPSGAYIWFNCPRQPRAVAGLKSRSSSYAEEGTAAHQLGEKCLRNSVDAVDFLGGHVNIKDGTVGRDEQSGPGIFGVDEEMAEGVQMYLDECRRYMGDGWEWEIEARLDLRHIPEMEFGTGDFVAYHPDKKLLVVRDLKYGKRKVVEVVDNLQALIYAEGTAKRYHNRGLECIDIGIVQPRAPHKDGPVRNHVIDALDSVEFRFRLIDAAEATAAPDAPLVAGDHCMPFCLAAPTCEALRKYTLSAAEMEFADAPPPVTGMSPAEKAVVLAKAEVIEGWCKRVKESAHADALEGNGPPGWKLVESTSHRKFKDDVTAQTLAAQFGEFGAEDFLTTPKLISPAATEKLVGAKRKAKLVEYVTKPRGKIILVPDADPRPSVKANAEDEFA